MTPTSKRYFIIGRITKKLIIEINFVTDKNLSSQTLPHLSKLY